MRSPRRLIPLLVILAGGLFIWRTGLLGVFPTDRTVIWRFPVSYQEVRRLELQLWQGEELLKREEQSLPSGLVGEPSFKVPLEAGVHRAVANVWLGDAAAPVGFQREFDPAGDETVVIEMKKP